MSGGLGLAATIVEGRDLLETVIASAVAGLGIIFAFSLAIWGFGRSTELAAEGRRAAAGSAAAVGGLALVVVAAAVVVGIVVMAHK